MLALSDHVELFVIFICFIVSWTCVVVSVIVVDCSLCCRILCFLC